MGSNQSVGYKEVHAHINHPKFKNAKIYTQNLISKLITEIPIQEVHFKQWQKQLLLHQFNPQFLLLPEKSYFSSQRFCSAKGSVKIIYDNFPYLLKNQIHDRIGKKQPFNEEQIWYLLLAIFSAKKEFTEKKVNHGNLGQITLENIFLSLNGNVKIANYLSWPGQQETLQKIVSQENKHFLAPEDFDHLSLGMTYCKSTNESQIFAIGMTVLSAGILKDNTQLYNFNAKKFNFNEALIRISQWRMSNYSDLLKATVQLLCQFQPYNRLKASQIGQILYRSQNTIKAKKKFSACFLPNRIQTKIRQYKTEQYMQMKSINLSKMSSIQSPQVPSQKQESTMRLPHKIFNSLNLTQVILGQNNVGLVPTEKKSSNSQSLFSSIDQVSAHKSSSEFLKEQKPLQRYQEINANTADRNSNSLSDAQYLNLINLAKQIIVQKPIVVDTKRRSDDIEEQATPKETPVGTPNGSVIEESRAFTRTFQVPNNSTKLSTNMVEKSPLSKTTFHNKLHPHAQFNYDYQLRVKSTKSTDHNQSMGRDDLNRTNNSTVTMYIPLETEPFDKSTKNIWQSQLFKQKPKSFQSKQIVIPEGIQQLSKQCSEIQLSNLSESDKLKIEQQILQRIQKSKQQPHTKKIVKFASQKQVFDLSHQSKILQIDDIDLDFLEDINRQSDKILVGYKEPNEDQIVIQSVNVSRKGSCLSSANQLH